jgi:predicted metal-dependent enzyme (double-stranded beta helix superfamily)
MKEDRMTVSISKEAQSGPELRLDRLRQFVSAFGRLLDVHPRESDLLRDGAALLSDLIALDDWLPARYAQPDPQRYRQYLLHADSAERFSVVSFVWGPGQTTPIHNHTTWGLIGVLRGAEVEQRFDRNEAGELIPQGEPQRLDAGKVDAVSPRIGDIHRVSNAYSDRPSISIHIYGGNIGAIRRSVYELNGASKVFISGYSNEDLPNIWDRSRELRAD